VTRGTNACDARIAGAAPYAMLVMMWLFELRRFGYV
jgi:hypothetical protein